MALGGGGALGLLAVLAIGYFLGIDVTPLLDDGALPMQQPTQMTEADRQAGQFVSVALADTEEIWSRVFQDQLGARYAPTVLVLYKGITASPCGNASGATGPFYCPQDRKVYLDTDFFTTLSRKLGAGGDFAAAYVVAHEVGHHVQDEIGILTKANALRARATEAQANAISVRIELQADCFAGIWAKKAETQLGTLEDGDVAEAMNAARQIGDDMLQRNAGRVPVPESFTHGTSAQRQEWFATGYASGRLAACDTFGAERL